MLLINFSSWTEENTNIYLNNKGKYASIVKKYTQENQDILDYYNSVKVRNTIIRNCIKNRTKNNEK